MTNPNDTNETGWDWLGEQIPISDGIGVERRPVSIHGQNLSSRYRLLEDGQQVFKAGAAIHAYIQQQTPRKRGGL